MDIGLNKNQKMMVKEARKFLTKECSAEYIREIYESENTMDRVLWKKMVEMDWLSLCIPEIYGGVGGNFTDLCLLLEETGRALLPGNFFSTSVFSLPALIEYGSEEQKNAVLPAIACGDKTLTLAMYEPKSEKNAGVFSFAENDSVIHLDGVKLFVPDALSADYIIVSSEDPKHSDDVTLLLVENNKKNIECKPLKTLDGTKKLYEVTFNNMNVPEENVIGRKREGKSILESVFKKAMVGLSFENIGGAQKAMELAVEYAKNRVQFDRPIGSFQVIKHQCVDMLTMIEEAKILMQYAAWAIENDTPDNYPSTLASFIYSTEVYRKVTDLATHIHGAIGVTWENDMHLYYKRAIGNELIIGKKSDRKTLLADWFISEWKKAQS